MVYGAGLVTSCTQASPLCCRSMLGCRVVQRGNGQEDDRRRRSKTRSTASRIRAGLVIRVQAPRENERPPETCTVQYVAVHIPSRINGTACTPDPRRRAVRPDHVVLNRLRPRKLRWVVFYASALLRSSSCRAFPPNSIRPSDLHFHVPGTLPAFDLYLSLN